MSKLTQEERALQTISVRGPFLLDVSTINDGWFQTSSEPLDTDPDGFLVDGAMAEALIKSGKVVEVARGHPPDDHGTRITAYRVA